MTHAILNLLAKDEWTHKVTITTGKAVCHSMDEKLFPLDIPEIKSPKAHIFFINLTIHTLIGKIGDYFNDLCKKEK